MENYLWLQRTFCFFSSGAPYFVIQFVFPSCLLSTCMHAACMYVCMYVCMYIQIYAYIHRYKYTYESY